MALIEEMMDLKVQMRSGAPGTGKPELAQLLAKKRYEDQQRLGLVRQQIVALLNG